MTRGATRREIGTCESRQADLLSYEHQNQSSNAQLPALAPGLCSLSNNPIINYGMS